METETIKPIELKWVTKTYRGKTGCACGCGGTYADSGTAAASQRVAFINKNLGDVVAFHWEDESCYEIENDEGTRVTRVYVKAGH